MKKLISVLLSVILIFTIATPCFAEAEQKVPLSLSNSDIPVVSIYGDGEPLYNQEGEKVFHFSEILSMLGGTEEGAFGEAMINILMPFLIEGLLNDEWDNYYKALEKEIGDIFKEVRLDDNGEDPENTVDVSVERKAEMERKLSVNSYETQGFYGFEDYHFIYDWRLDPYAVADLFHEHIEKVKQVTGHDKVAIVIRCLGSSVVFAYIEKYGLDSIHGISMNSIVSNGAEIISEPISGKFKLDGDAINRFLYDMKALGMLDIDSFINDTINMLEKTEVFYMLTDVVKQELYGKLVMGVTSALSTSTFFTWPAYWSCVAQEDLDDALLYVFGPEGSEKRNQYAGLIEKIENYHEKVGSKTYEIVKSIKDEGKNLCIISKYGFQIVPICESRNEIGDQFVSTKRSSFGATTADVYQPLEEGYVKQQYAAGLGRYISPDKLVDASTCLFPDYTWFMKGSSHSVWSNFENSILYTVATADEQLTVNDFECTQFVYRNNATDEACPLTEENCNTESWSEDSKTDTYDSPYGKYIAMLRILIDWLGKLIKLISGLFPAEV